MNYFFRLLPIKLKVFHDFTTNIATLSFCENDIKDFRLKSIKLIYGYEGQEIPKDRMECISNSNLYKFSTKDIDRHVFHTKYSCEVTVLDQRKSYNMEFKFIIPHFKTKTEIAFTFLAARFPSIPIINIFNKKFIDHPSLSPEEKDLLCNLQ